MGTPNEWDYKTVHLELTAKNESGDTRAGLGILCSQQVVNLPLRDFLMITDGESAIARATVGDEDLFLANNDNWATSEAIPEGASSYRLGTDCGQGKPTLYINGHEVDSVSDSSLTVGGIPVFLWSAEEPPGAISYDDLLMTYLE